MNKLQQIRNDHHSFKLTGRVASVSPIAQATALATGTAPGVNGVVADAWLNDKGEHVAAFSAPLSASSAVVGTVADVISQSFSGHSLTLSASATAGAALAGSTHHSVRAAHPAWNDVALGIKGSSFASLFPTAHRSLEFSLSDLGHHFSNEGLSLAKEAHFEVSEHKVTIAIGGNSAVFNLNVEENIEFLGELAFVDHVLQELKDNSALQALVADEFPDVYSFVLTGLRGVRERHGEDSKEHAVAVALLDAAIPRMIKRFAALYQNDLMAEVVVMGASRHHLDDAVAAKIRDNLPATVNAELFPALYVRAGNVAHPALVCAHVRSQLAAAHLTESVTVECHGPAAQGGSPQFLAMDSATIAKQMQLMGSGASATAAAPTDKQIQIYQICLWTGVGLVGVLAMALYSLVYMNNRKDTMLYSRFNPNWYALLVNIFDCLILIFATSFIFIFVLVCFVADAGLTASADSDGVGSGKEKNP
jgi:hypothetical protein